MARPEKIRLGDMPGFFLLVHPRTARSMKCRGTVVFGTRPEHLTLASAGGISAQVVVMEPTGMDTFIACRHDGVDFSAVFRERHDFAPGTTIRLQPDLQRAHLFDAATGQRLAA